MRDDEEEAEFGLEDAIVSAREPAGGPVGNRADEEKSGGGAEESADVHVADFDFGEERGVAHELSKEGCVVGTE